MKTSTTFLTWITTTIVSIRKKLIFLIFFEQQICFYRFVDETYQRRYDVSWRLFIYNTCQKFRCRSRNRNDTQEFVSMFTKRRHWSIFFSFVICRDTYFHFQWKIERLKINIDKKLSKKHNQDYEKKWYLTIISKKTFVINMNYENTRSKSYASTNQFVYRFTINCFKFEINLTLNFNVTSTNRW